MASQETRAPQEEAEGEGQGKAESESQAESEEARRAQDSSAAGEEASRRAVAPPRPSLIDDVAAHGFAQIDDFVSPELTARLRARCLERDASGEMRPARIGRGANERNATDVRGDFIAWLESPADDAECALVEKLETLRLELNRELMAGLVDFEGHFARYPAGAGYARHIDRLAGSDVRVVSAVLYLNEDWRKDDGGQLRLHLAGDSIDVIPHGGKLVVFRSELFEHEVLPATRERLSFTGWFRRRPA
jgi:SM-20-related protein